MILAEGACQVRHQLVNRVRVLPPIGEGIGEAPEVPPFSIVGHRRLEDLRVTATMVSEVPHQDLRSGGQLVVCEAVESLPPCEDFSDTIQIEVAQVSKTPGVVGARRLVAAALR